MIEIKDPVVLENTCYVCGEPLSKGGPVIAPNIQAAIAGKAEHKSHSEPKKAPAKRKAKAKVEESVEE